MKALDIGSSRQLLSNPLPVFAIESGDSRLEQKVFIGGPVSLVGPILVFGRACLVDVRVIVHSVLDLELVLLDQGGEFLVPWPSYQGICDCCQCRCPSGRLDQAFSIGSAALGCEVMNALA